MNGRCRVTGSPIRRNHSHCRRIGVNSVRPVMRPATLLALTCRSQISRPFGLPAHVARGRVLLVVLDLQVRELHPDAGQVERVGVRREAPVGVHQVAADLLRVLDRLGRRVAGVLHVRLGRRLVLVGLREDLGVGVRAARPELLLEHLVDRRVHVGDVRRAQALEHAVDADVVGLRGRHRRPALPARVERLGAVLAEAEAEDALGGVALPDVRDHRRAVHPAAEPQRLAGEHQVLHQEVRLVVGAHGRDRAHRRRHVGRGEAAAGALEAADRLVGDRVDEPDLRRRPAPPTPSRSTAGTAASRR